MRLGIAIIKMGRSNETMWDWGFKDYFCCEAVYLLFGDEYMDHNELRIEVTNKALSRSMPVVITDVGNSCCRIEIKHNPRIDACPQPYWVSKTMLRSIGVNFNRSKKFYIRLASKNKKA